MDMQPRRLDADQEFYQSKRFKAESGYVEHLLSHVVRLTARGYFEQESWIDIGVDDPAEIADELTAIAALIRVKVKKRES
jgi:hypothetical protein